MNQPLHKTKGIVLRTVKYGETSLIVSIYTQVFGLQSYIVQGVRSATKKMPARANYFQPGALLDLVVYHNERSQLQRIREFRWSVLYEHLLTDIVKNSVLLYIVELVQKTIKQPEANEDLFAFLEDALLQLDTAQPIVTASFPLFFALHFSTFFGFQLSLPVNESATILDLKEGVFTQQPPTHMYYTEGATATAMQELLRVMQPNELPEVPLSHELRRQLLEVLEIFYQLHVSEFGKMKTTPILKEVLS